jgi:hypothetical protein
LNLKCSLMAYVRLGYKLMGLLKVIRS